MPISHPDDLKGGAPKENARALKEILSGSKNAYRDIVVANSAAVLLISNNAETLEDAVARSSSILDNGQALDLLHDYAEFTQSVRQEG